MDGKKRTVRTRLELPDRKILPIPTENDAVMAQTYGGLNGRSGGKFEKQVREELGIQFPFLTDEQWDMIAPIGNFHRHFRFELNIALQAYWSSRLDEARIPDISLEISTAREALDKASHFVNLLLKSNVPFNGMLEPHEQSFSEQKLDMLTALEAMKRTDRLLERAEERLSRGRGRPPSYGDLPGLVQKLDVILYMEKFRVLDRSKKRIDQGSGTPLEFAWAVIQVADPHVSKPRAEKVVEDHIRDRHRFERKLAEYKSRNPDDDKVESR